jgi:hypothetical protein
MESVVSLSGAVQFVLNMHVMFDAVTSMTLSEAAGSTVVHAAIAIVSIIFFISVQFSVSCSFQCDP